MRAAADHDDVCDSSDDNNHLHARNQHNGPQCAAWLPTCLSADLFDTTDKHHGLS